MIQNISKQNPIRKKKKALFNNLIMPISVTSNSYSLISENIFMRIIT